MNETKRDVRVVRPGRLIVTRVMFRIADTIGHRAAWLRRWAVRIVDTAINEVRTG